jgi:type II secretory pathway pseudopilin PulG
MELMIVIMIVSILAGVALPLMQGNINRAKWSEANAAAGTIRTAVSAYVARYGIEKAQSDLVGQSLNSNVVRAALGFDDKDLITTYFVPEDYEIISINEYGNAEIKVTSSVDKAPEGEKTLYANGDWL